jgi:hypothetical protein
LKDKLICNFKLTVDMDGGDFREFVYVANLKREPVQFDEDRY